MSCVQSDGIVCPISIKYGGKKICRSASAVIYSRPPKISPSIENSLPSMYSSTMARPLREYCNAVTAAFRNSERFLTSEHPRAPMLSTGFTTSGKRPASSPSRRSSVSAVAAPRSLYRTLPLASKRSAGAARSAAVNSIKAGDGTPALRKHSRIRTLSVALSAASSVCPRKPQAAATAATAAEKSVAAVNTASSPPFCCKYRA